MSQRKILELESINTFKKIQILKVFLQVTLSSNMEGTLNSARAGHSMPPYNITVLNKLPLTPPMESVCASVGPKKQVDVDSTKLGIC